LKLITSLVFCNSMSAGRTLKLLFEPIIYTLRMKEMITWQSLDLNTRFQNF
jgi:hypothetical protein